MHFSSTKWIVIVMQYRHITTTLALTSAPGPLLVQALGKYPHLPLPLSGPANALSRALLSGSTPETKEPPYSEYDINTLTPAITETRLNQIRQASQTDPSLQALKSCIQQGWPKSRSLASVATRPYWNYKDELTASYSATNK